MPCFGLLGFFVLVIAAIYVSDVLREIVSNPPSSNYSPQLTVSRRHMIKKVASHRLKINSNHMVSKDNIPYQGELIREDFPSIYRRPQNGFEWADHLGSPSLEHTESACRPVQQNMLTEDDQKLIVEWAAKIISQHQHRAI